MADCGMMTRECPVCWGEIAWKADPYWYSWKEVVKDGGIVTCPDCKTEYVVTYDAHTDNGYWQDDTSLSKVTS